MSEITATLTKKIGPLPAWSYAVIGGGLGLLFLLKKKPATAQAAVGTGTLPVQAIGTGDGGGSGGGGGGGGGGETITPTPTPISPFTQQNLTDPTIPRFSQDQYNQLSQQYETVLSQLMNLQNGSSPITPAPTNPVFVPPQTTYINPVGPAGPVNQPAYSPSFQVPNPPLLHYIGGPLGGMNLPAQVASALSGGNGGKTLYVGGPLNGQYL